MVWLCFAVSLLASVGGSICGIGGGIIIKPILDLLGVGDTAIRSCMSGFAVLSMSAYSLGNALLTRSQPINWKTATPLSLGAALGGVLGKEMLSLLLRLFPQGSGASRVQAVCILALTLLTLVYTQCKAKVRSLNIHGSAVSAGIGGVLGCISGFLGIGGGPVNLVVLHYFFGMPTKEAALSSLYIIFCSQSAGFLAMVLGSGFPAVSPAPLVLVGLGGILGGIVGRRINRKIRSRTVDKLFLFMLVLICLICGWNILK